VPFCVRAPRGTFPGTKLRSGNGFELVEGGLEDVYLSTLTRARRTAAQKAA